MPPPADPLRVDSPPAVAHLATSGMHVTKRDGRRQPVSFDKILQRLYDNSEGLEHVDIVLVAQKTIAGLYDGVTTASLDMLAAETAAYLSTTHPQYSSLAARIELSNLAKQTPPTLVEAARRAGLAAETLGFIERHADRLEAALRHERDAAFDFFAVKTLQKSYLRRDATASTLEVGLAPIVERPQYMYMRIAAGIHGAAEPRAGDVEAVLETYELLSRGWASHATPTMFNSGTAFPQMASCFLLQVPADSIQGIFQAVTWAAQISKYAGGVGMSVSNVRSKGSRIRSSDGVSNGLVPMLQVFDKVARYVDQGGGKRKGAIAVYVDVYHPDVLDVLDMKKNHGKEELKARDLFYGLWVRDEFMRRVDADEEWSLLCPDACQELAELHGEAFDAAYRRLERELPLGPARTAMPARALWTAILDAQIETGGPYMLYADSCNAKSNHQHLGALKCSNLCTEILEHVSPDEVAVCNLASISLPACLADGRSGGGGEGGEGGFDFGRLERIARTLVRNLNRVIDRSFYPLEEARRSNLRHRPMGIGVQGLADVFLALRMPFASDAARRLNARIFETIHFAALSESVELAKAEGPYPSYEGSPLARGRLQPDLWDAPPTDERHDWSALRRALAQHGARNSLLVAPMPTASTAQILGNVECFEPITSNMYTRRVLSGEFAVVNKWLVRDLEAIGMWTAEVRDAIVRDNGSVQNVDGLPAELKELYRTVWEIKMRTVIDMAADRAPYIDQSQSLNLFVAAPTHAKLTAMHMHAWKRGLKTGMYYLRTRPAADAIKVTTAPIPPPPPPPPPRQAAAPSCGESGEEAKEGEGGTTAACPYRPGEEAGGCEACSA